MSVLSIFTWHAFDVGVFDCKSRVISNNSFTGISGNVDGMNKIPCGMSFDILTGAVISPTWELIFTLSPLFRASLFASFELTSANPDGENCFNLGAFDDLVLVPMWGNAEPVSRVNG